MTRTAMQPDLFVIVRTPSGVKRAVSVRIAPDRPVSELVARLATHLGLEPGSMQLHVPGRPAGANGSGDIAGLNLRMGDELWLVSGDELAADDRRHPRSVRPASPWNLVLAGGPLAGRVFPLRSGEQTLGRAAQADVRLPDEAVSRSHLVLSADDESVTLSPAGPRAGTYLEGRPIGRGHRVQSGEVFEVGHSLVTFRARHLRTERRTRLVGGRVHFNRPPAAPVPAPELDFKLPAAPAESPRLRIPTAAVLVPLIVGIAIWFATRNILFLLFAVATPLMAALPALEDRVIGRWQRRRQARRYRRLVADACRTLSGLRVREARAWRAQVPDPPDLEDRARLVLPTLWERRPHRPGFLRLRLGWGDLPSAIRVEVPDGGRQDLRQEAAAAASAGSALAAVPITLDLSEVGSLGLAGPPPAVAGLARWLIVQAAALHIPHELAVAAFLSRRAAEEWEWLRWLPHVRGAGLDADVQPVTQAPEEQRRLAVALEELLAGRNRDQPGLEGALLVLVHEDGPAERAAFSKVLESAGASRVFVIWVGSEPDLLPDACDAVAEVSSSGTELRFRLMDSEADVTGIPDLVDVDYAERVARSLSGIEALGAHAARNALPGSVGLIECLEMRQGLDLAEAVRQRWSAPPGDLSSPVGVAADGVLSVDLREQGPHALVGGTSGSGKSEFLRAWVTALAAAHSPRRLNFLLVDFKGGTAFQDCARLPHVVGVVTDLSDHLLGRIQQSLLAELKRREAEMTRFAQKEFVEFERQRPDDAPPVLVVVFDEFEQLLAEHPGFVTEVIVPIARLGRGLGVHLVLGTQKPQGSVPEAIRSNTNIRVALRMLSEPHSRDVIDSPGAAHIPPGARGRAYLRLSHQSLVSFQVAYSGARSRAEPDEPTVSDLRAGDGPALPTVHAGDGVGPSDFERLAAAMMSVNSSLGLAGPRRPWLPPLPEILPLATMHVPGGPPSNGPQAVLGLVDEPRGQAQWALTHSLFSDGHLLVYGLARSGKSTLLRTFACSLTSTSSPSQLWLYGLDFSGGALRGLEALPHVGGVASAADPERVAQLLRTLMCEAASRHRNGRPGQPSIALLVDEYATFRSVFERVDGGRYVDLLEALVRDGRALGIYCVLTSSQRRDLSGLLSAAIPRRLLLRPDRQEAEALGLAADCRPASVLPPGRGFLDGRMEVQLAVLADGTPDAEAEAVRALGERLTAAATGDRAPGIAVLPDAVRSADLPAPGAALRAVIGLGGDTAAPVEVDLLAHGHLALCGPRGSGRTSALAAVAASVGRAGHAQRLVLLSPRQRSELSTAARWFRVALGVDQCAELAAALTTEPALAAEPLVVLVDDAELLMEGAADGALRALTRLGRDLPLRVAAAVEIRAMRRYSEWMTELRESRHAVVLNPDVSADGELFGAGPLPRPLRPWPPGRGFLIRAGQVVPVQVAT